MKVIPLQEFVSDANVQLHAGKILREDNGLVCFPCSGNYRLAANVLSQKAVMTLLQTKRRSKHRPALVMVDGVSMAAQVVDPIPDAARRLMNACWPGNVTVKLPLTDDLPRKVYRELSKPHGKVGVRFPDGPLTQKLLHAAGVPLLVSSANVSKKAGADSVAMIRKQFSRSISVFIDAGDLPNLAPSTVVEFDDDGQANIVRQGSVPEPVIRQAVGG